VGMGVEVGEGTAGAIEGRGEGVMSGEAAGVGRGDVSNLGLV